MNKQYDYEARFNELSQGIDSTFKNILEPFIYGYISEYIKSIQTPIDILDVGCGCGYLTANIAKTFTEATVTGIDISESAIAFAKSHFDMEFSHLDILDIDESKKFDIVVYNMVLHNLEHLNKAMQKTSMILKDNGIVLITIPHPSFWLPDKISRGKIILEEPFNYSLERFYEIPFQIKNGSRHGTTLTLYHRRLTTYINTFLKYLELAKFQEVDFKNGYPTMLQIILKSSKN